MLRALMQLGCPALLIAAAATCDPKGTDYFLTEVNVGGLSGLITSNGTPVNGATVTLTGAATRTATTGSTGAFNFSGIPAGDYTVNVTITNFVCAPGTATVLAHQSATVNLSCTPEPGTIGGTIRLNLLPQQGVQVAARQGTTTVGTATSGSNGTYSIANLPPGSYSAVVTAPANSSCNPAQQSVTVQSNQTATANFDCTSLPGSISGTVLVDGSGRSGVAVSLAQGATAVGTTTTGTGGTYSFSNLPPGTYSASITPPVSTVCSSNPQDVIVLANQNSTANFTCTSLPGSVTGTVLVNGAGQLGVLVTLTQGANTIGTATTGASGAYTIANVPPGTYSAAITPPSGTTCSNSPQSVTVQSNQPATANFTCTSLPGSVTGTVLVNGAGQLGVLVTLTQGANTIGTATTGASGAYTIANVPPGTYSAAITPPSGTTCSNSPQSVTVQSNQPATANFTCSISNDFAVSLIDPQPSYRHIVNGVSAETCTGISTNPARPGGSWTATWSGTGTVGVTQRSGTLDATGHAVDRQPINQVGTYSINVTVIANSLTRSASGSVVVTAAAGSCPP